MEHVSHTLNAALASLKALIDSMPPDAEPADRFEPQYDARGYQVATAEEVIIARRRAIGLPLSLMDCTFANWECRTDEHTRLVERVERWVGDLPRHLHTNYGHSLLLTGPTGSGKSHLGVSALKALCEIGLMPRFAACDKLAMDLKSEWSSDLVNEWIEPDLALFDDLGTGNSGPSADERLRIILSQRISEQRPTIITTNLDSGSLGKLLSDRLMSRVNQSYAVQMIKLPDARFYQRSNQR